MHFFLAQQHTLRDIGLVMKHTLTMAAEVLTVLLILITGALLLAL